MQVEEVSVEEMWKAIEVIGIKRELLDPHHDLSYNTVKDLYTTIKSSPIINRC